MPTHTPRRLYTNTPDVVLTAQAAEQTSDCIKWTFVTATMIGQKRCVYGNAHKTRFVGESTYQILFSGDAQDFFLAGGTYNYNVGSGDCVVAEGEILRSATGVPYIDIDEGLYQCKAWMQ
jgi:hypothetical protein